MAKRPVLSEAALDVFRARTGDRKLFAQALMPVRGTKGFRKLDYEFAKQLEPDAIVKKCADHNFNAFGLVVKDTDGAVTADPSIAWNPTGRDLVKEFEEACQRHNMLYILSITSMNDAYRGATHPETVSVHIKNGRNYKAGDIATHREGEMRVDLPEGIGLEEMKKIIPFLTDEKEEVAGKSRGTRGTGYVPLTSFHCPRSEHRDYMVDLVGQLTSRYHVDGVFADYIRFDGSYTDLCGCPRCRAAFAERYPGKKIMGSKQWLDFREETIVEYGTKFNAAVKAVDEKIITGWFQLTGPKLFTRNRVAQNYTKLGETMDTVVPMLYPFLMGTADDGRRWRIFANLAHWYTQFNMNQRFHEYPKDKPILVITNTAECNAEEMLLSCMAYDYGLGISLFKFYGTTEAQWAACKAWGALFSVQKAGDPAPGVETAKAILKEVYATYPPKNGGKYLKWPPSKLGVVHKQKIQHRDDEQADA
jgi:hypothetical protein